MDNQKEIYYQNQIQELQNELEEAHGGHGSTAWKLAFADFMTVLMALFLILWLQGSNEELLSKVHAEFNPSGNSVIHDSEADVFQPETETLMDKQVVYKQEDMEFKMKTDELFEYLQRLNRNTLAPNFKILKIEDGLKITLGDSFFEVGSSRLKRQSISKLKRTLGMAFRMHREYFDQIYIRVHGHTDNIPLNGGRYLNNWGLAAMRSVETIMAIEQTGIPLASLRAISHGEHLPIVDNSTKENRAKNRRIEIVLVKK